MAVHLNARLKTRFIPVLFSVMIAFSLISAIVHAHAEEIPPQAGADTAAPDELSREEMRELLGKVIDGSRVDRRPGFSPITYATRPSEVAAQTIGYPKNTEEPTAGADSWIEDRVSTQPSEPEAGD